MFKRGIAYSLSIMILAPIIFFACSKDVATKPNFIFKSAPDTSAAFKVNGKVISKAEAFKGIEGEIFAAEIKVYELKLGKIKAQVLESLMMADPRRKGLTNDQFLEKFIQREVKISDMAIKGFIKERKIPKEHVNDKLKQRVVKFLQMEEKKKAVDLWVARQTAKKPVEIYLKKPSRPVFDVNISDSPFMGDADAKVTIVEFSDFQCPYCGKATSIIHKLQKKYGNKIKIVFKQYPLPFHTNARGAAEAALCANEQGTTYFWKMHDKMFEDQSKLAPDELLKTAKGIGLNSKKFSECVTTHRMHKTVEANIADGKKVGVQSTPTFFVNGQLVSGALPVSVFSEIIDAELAK